MSRRKATGCERSEHCAVRALHGLCAAATRRLGAGAALAASLTVATALILTCAAPAAGLPPGGRADVVGGIIGTLFPRVASTNPSYGATAVPGSITPTVTFSGPSYVPASAFTLDCPAGTPEELTVSPAPATQFKLTPSSRLPAGMTCTVTVRASVARDFVGLPSLAPNYSFSFTTDSPPTVAQVSPANGAQKVSVGASPTVTFSEPVDATEPAFTLQCPVGTPEGFTVSPAPPATMFTLTPTDSLPSGTTCTVTVLASRVTDLAGSSLASNYEFAFADGTTRVPGTRPLSGGQHGPPGPAPTGAATTPAGAGVSSIVSPAAPAPVPPTPPSTPASTSGSTLARGVARSRGGAGIAHAAGGSNGSSAPGRTGSLPGAGGRGGGVAATPAGRHGHSSSGPLANPRRSMFAAYLRPPTDVPLSLTDIGRSLALSVLLLLLLGFPARLFNATSKANRRRFTRWLASAGRRVRVHVPAPLPRLAKFAAVSALVATAVHAFLNPGFPTRPGSGAFALGMLLGWLVILTNTAVHWRRYIASKLPGTPGRWHLYPGQIAVSAFCVAVSRFAHFVPGLIFGMAGDYEPDRRIELEHRGRRIARTLSSLAAISLLAWVASIPAGNAAERPNATFAVLTLDAALSVIAVTGMQTLFFSLTPLVFLDGYDLRAWRPRLWFLLWASGALWFSLVVLNPALSHPVGETRASLAWLAGLLVAETIIAMSLWSFFALRGRELEGLPSAG
jgi:hypothetical protein